MNNKAIISVLALIVLTGSAYYFATYNQIKKPDVPINLEEIRKQNELWEKSEGSATSTQNEGSENVFVKNTPRVVQNSDTYTYKNHGFTIELPKGFVPVESLTDYPGVSSLSLPGQDMYLWYVTDIPSRQNIFGEKVYVKDIQLGETVFKLYQDKAGINMYWWGRGQAGYAFTTFSASSEEMENILKTFKFVGWPSVSLDMTNQYAQKYKTLFTTEFAKLANLAGRFRVVAPGCGSSCINVYALDKTTGKVYSVGGGSEYRIVDNQIRVTVSDPQKEITVIYVFNPALDKFEAQSSEL